MTLIARFAFAMVGALASVLVLQLFGYHLSFFAAWFVGALGAWNIVQLHSRLTDKAG